ncbi:hypothetical protein GQX74_014128 [Glossina fuscipes]|nr:hypothetical protein GQX74_014128 [Glossina fuscipes]
MKIIVAHFTKVPKCLCNNCHFEQESSELCSKIGGNAQAGKPCMADCSEATATLWSYRKYKTRQMKSKINSMQVIPLAILACSSIGRGSFVVVVVVVAVVLALIVANVEVEVVVVVLVIVVVLVVEGGILVVVGAAIEKGLGFGTLRLEQASIVEGQHISINNVKRQHIIIFGIHFLRAVENRIKIQLNTLTTLSQQIFISQNMWNQVRKSI